MPRTPSRDPNAALRAGVAAYQQGRLEEAWAILSALRHAKALNIAAVCAQKLGRVEDAARAYGRASALAPTDPEIANNWGHFELGRGAVEAAGELFALALRGAPGMVAAEIGLAKVAAARKDWEAALAAWERIVAAAPASVEGRYGRGVALLETGRAEAAAGVFEALLQERGGPEVAFMLGRALLNLDRQDEAEARLREAHGQAPRAHTLRALANLYWMRGERGRFDALVREGLTTLPLVAIKLLLEAGDVSGAQAAWEACFAGRAPDADGWTLAAQIARIGGDGAGAAEAADQALALAPGHAGASDTRVVASLMMGAGTETLDRLAELKAGEPLAQNWIAHESTACRLVGAEGGRGEGAPALNDVERFVRAYDLGVPAGYGSVEGFNAALAETLRRLHTFAGRPLDQSLRGAATQTTRSLLDRDEAVVRAYIAALEGPIRQYLSAIGTGAGHPTTARNTGGYRFQGMWSVRQTGGGFHEAHVHPEGWISSAYYVAVPDGIEGAEDKAGWIGFGAPPYPTEPSLEALKWVAPRVGRLVLFPSYMWHGTRPIAEGGERITAPFDLVPGPG
ncbi:MAG: putative 2OG-Fe(II) oxygenase [Pseudomonadota bacterium]